MTDEYKFVITGKDATKRAFLSIRKNLGAVRAGVNSTQVKVAALAGAAGLGALVARSLQSGDALGKLADRVGATTEGLAGLQLITELNGESSESLTKSLQKMRRSVGEADQGVGEAKDAFKALGIELDDIRNLSADEQFIKIGAAIGELTDKNQQAAHASDIFGRSGIQLINTFTQGEEAMRGAREEAERLGIAMSRTDAAKIEAANDAMLRTKRRIDGIGNQLTIEFAPIIEELANQLTNAAGSTQSMAQHVETAFLTGVHVTGVFADGIHGVNILLNTAGVTAKWLGAAFVGTIDRMADVIFQFANTIKQGLILPFKGWLEIAALVPGMSDEANAALASINKTLQDDWKPPAAIQETLDQLTQGFFGAREELKSLLLEDLPSEVMKAKVDELFAAAQGRAGEIAKKAGLGLEDSQAGGSDDIAGQDAKEQERIQARLDRLNESYLTEFGMLQLKLTNEQALLAEALAAEQLTQAQHDANQLRATKKFEVDKAKLEKKAADAKKALQGNVFKTIGAIVGSENKKAFKIQKAAAIAQTAVSVPAAIMQTFKTLGWPAGILPAAAMAAEGARQIASIKSTSFGGGGGTASIGAGGGGSFGGSLPSYNQQDFQQPDNQQSGQVRNVIVVNGDVFTQDSSEFVTVVQDAVKGLADSDAVFIEEGTAQAEVLKR